MKYNFNKKEVEDLLFNKNLTIKAAAKTLNCTTIALQRFMRKEGIRIAKEYPQEMRDDVFKLLDTGNFTHKEIADQLNLTLTNVRSIVKARQAEKRNSTKNSNILGIDLFSKENSHLLWYLIGFITADGHINESSASIVLFQNNHDFLLKLQNLLQHKGKINQQSTPNRIYTLTLLDHKLYNFLLENKFDFDKRYTVPFLDCPKEELQYYIRGIFDGDGCIFYNYVSGRFETKCIQITSGSKTLAEGLKQCFTSLNWNVIVHEKQAKNPYYDVLLNRKEDMLKFCEFIYNDNLEFKLNTKYVKFIKYKKLIELDNQINDIVDTL